MGVARDLLNAYLSKNEVSQSDLARRAGLHPTAISKLSTGVRKEPDLATAVAIEEATDGAVPAKSWVLSEGEPAEPDDESGHAPTLDPDTGSHEVSR
jgi:transcriptional regulator with XRE-family HTH domain